MNMKLSIITINFNNLAGLKKTADSVISQTWKEFEWIIIDGGSTDGSKEFIVSLNDDLNRNGWNPITYWCSEPDKGIYNAMNKGIAKASGEFLNFMNSGDCYCQTDTLENIHIYFEREDADIICGRTIDSMTGEEIFPPLPEEQLLMKILILSPLSHQSAFIRKKLQVAHLYDESLSIIADWKFFMQCITFENVRPLYISGFIAKYDTNGISAQRVKERNEERYNILCDFYGKGVAELVMQYNTIRWNDFLIKTDFLLEHDVSLYVFVRRCLSLAMKYYHFKTKMKQKFCKCKNA